MSQRMIKQVLKDVFARTEGSWDNGILHTAKVLGCAGKATGKHKSWYNLMYIEPTYVAGTTGSADMSGIENLHVETVTNNTDVCDDVFVTKDVSKL